MPKAILFRFAVAAATILSPAFSIITLAQEHLGAWHERAYAAMKFDEFGEIGSCDLGARLDNVAIEIMNNDEIGLNLVIYAASEQLYQHASDIFVNYLILTRGIDSSRLRTIYAGVSRNPTQTQTELWVGRPESFNQIPITPSPDLTLVRGKIYDGFVYDSVFEYDGTVADEGVGPSVPRSSLAAISEILKAQPKSIAYLVVYSDFDSLPLHWKRSGESKISALHSKGVDPDQLKLLFGGYEKKSRMEFWVLPSDAEPPVIERVEELPKEARIIEEIGQYNAHAIEQGKSLKAVAEILKSVGDSNLIFYVFPPPEEDEDLANEAGELFPEEDDLNQSFDETEGEEWHSDATEPYVDLLSIASAWKGRLSQDYGIDSHRMIVVPLSTPRESYGVELVLYLVPPGQPLPDPYAEPVTEEQQNSQNETPR